MPQAQAKVSEADLTFETLKPPYLIHNVTFIPTEPGVKKFAYAVEDETGWVKKDGDVVRAHPALMSNYLWWPQGFYVQESTGAGHFLDLHERHPALIETPYLHTKTIAKFYEAPPVDQPILATASVIDKYIKKDKEFIAIGCDYRAEDGRKLADYQHHCMIRSRVPLGSASPSAKSSAASAATKDAATTSNFNAKPVQPFDATVTLAHARLYSLPLESFHTHDSIAQANGFRKAVPQGLMSFAYLVRLCNAYFGPSWMDGGEIEVTFVRMLERDDTLSVNGVVAESKNDCGRTNVRLDLFIDNQNGQRVAAGSAIGSLAAS